MVKTIDLDFQTILVIFRYSDFGESKQHISLYFGEWFLKVFKSFELLKTQFPTMVKKPFHLYIIIIIIIIIVINHHHHQTILAYPGSFEKF